MRVAIIHYWLVGMRGGEKVLEEIASLYPEADIYAHVADPGRLSSALAQREIRQTFIGGLPFARPLRRGLAPVDRCLFVFPVARLVGVRERRSGDQADPDESEQRDLEESARPRAPGGMASSSLDHVVSSSARGVRTPCTR